MKLSDLVGYQLVAINEDEIKVKKDNMEHTIHIREDEGGCCGFNEIVTTLFIDEEELRRNPIITAVRECETTKDDDCADGMRILFIGEQKQIADLDSYSSSGSGWCYGACVWVECDSLELQETLTSY